MTSSKEKWHYWAVTQQSGLHIVATSRYVGDICCLNYFHLFRAKNEGISYKKGFRNHIFCEILMPNKK